MLTVVIPTRNRPADLTNAIKSLCYQSRLPDELIVVDQSADDLSVRSIKSLETLMKKFKLIYIHDSNILGLVEAKRVAVKNASGQICICNVSSVQISTSEICTREFCAC